VNRGDLTTAVWFDLDSTLADTRHRWGLSPMADPSSDWHAYCAARIGDDPVLGAVAAARAHYQYSQVHVFSGSEESSRLVTLEWLDLHRIPFDGLRQRKDGDDRPNHEVKVDGIRELQAAGLHVLLGYEDHPEVAALVYEATRVPVLVVNPCYPEDEERFRRGKFDGLGGGL
jgi:hypothetical protein